MIKQTYGYAYSTITRRSMRVWWVNIKIPDTTFISYPVRQKLNKNQLRKHLRRFNKYRKISGHTCPESGIRCSGAVAREKVFHAGWFTDYKPIAGKLHFNTP